MFCTTSETEGKVEHLKLVKLSSPQQVITDRSKAVVSLWFPVACLCFRVSVTFHLTCVHIFSSVWVFGEIAAHSVDHMLSL